ADLLPAGQVVARVQQHLADAAWRASTLHGPSVAVEGEDERVPHVGQSGVAREAGNGWLLPGEDTRSPVGPREHGAGATTAVHTREDRGGDAVVVGESA